MQYSIYDIMNKCPMTTHSDGGLQTVNLADMTQQTDWTKQQ